MASPHPNNPDVVVIGGGPAGSTISTLLAQHGCRVRLFERERFPRFHIGESLIPDTYWVFQRLKMLDKMKASPFVKKYSVQFVSASGKLSAPFYFWDNKPHECSQTWQVIRGEFDLLMLHNAAEQGVDVHQGTRVLEVLFDAGQAVGIGVTMLLHCDLIVAARSAQFTLPFVALGLVPEAGSSLLLPRLVGYQRAAELLYLGQPFNADTAYRLGLVNSVVEEAALADEARALARSVAQQPADALQATRRLLRGDVQELLARIEEEARIFGAQLQSEEFRARVRAFLGRGRAS